VPDPLAGRQRRQRAVEPARLDEARRRHPALEHVLAVEMRAVAVAGGGRMHDDAGLLSHHARKVRHPGIEREEAVERQRRRRPVKPHRELAVQRDVVGIADRADRRETVERAAQHQHDEAGVARAGRRGDLGDHRRAEERATAGEKRASRGMRNHRLSSVAFRAT
jgi:hypothetical protein